LRNRARPRGGHTPRQRRFAPPGFPNHVGNRGNERRRLFFEKGDYERFLQLLLEGKRRYDVKLFGVSLIPNHFHAIIQPEAIGALSSYVQWVAGGYSSYFRFVTATVGTGHLFQDRFWNRGIEDSDHFLTVLRYVEANPLQAGLDTEAEDWPWNSLVLRHARPELLDPLPVVLPDNWPRLVREPVSQMEINRIAFASRIRALDRARQS
jgi:putative transposase